MNIRICTFVDPLGQGSVWAVAGVEGSAITEGALASGTDDRAASNAALAAFWKREDLKVQATAAESVTADGTADLAVSEWGIRGLVEHAAVQRLHLEICYVDSSGARTRRVIVPSEVSGEIVAAWDVGKRDARTFRIDRIESAEVVR